jgi:hypothetical protein
MAAQEKVCSNQQSNAICGLIGQILILGRYYPKSSRQAFVSIFGFSERLSPALR